MLTSGAHLSNVCSLVHSVHGRLPQLRLYDSGGELSDEITPAKRRWTFHRPLSQQPGPRSLKRC